MQGTVAASVAPGATVGGLVAFGILQKGTFQALWSHKQIERIEMQPPSGPSDIGR